LSALAHPASASRADAAPSTIALLRVDATLREAVPADDIGFAERVLIVPFRKICYGPLCPETLVEASARPFAALLLRGVIAHEVMLSGRCSADLLGPGDVFRPWRSANTSLPCDERWTARGAAIAVLDERFVATARRWPGLSAVIYDRLAEQLEVAAVRGAIAGLPRVEQRVVALFWQLADRWGIVRPDGIRIELSLTHAMIGHLVGAQRPTVSLALQALAEEGLVRRGETGAWTLAHDSLATLAPSSDDPSARCGTRAGAAQHRSRPPVATAPDRQTVP
jgi:CRP/FNR family transcriptional regulator, cyclic AMP receptor protein